MDKHQQRFPLSDLLPVPIQRILRYPLLIKELEKCTKKSGSGSSGKLTKVIQLLEVGGGCGLLMFGRGLGCREVY